MIVVFVRKTMEGIFRLQSRNVLTLKHFQRDLIFGTALKTTLQELIIYISRLLNSAL